MQMPREQIRKHLKDLRNYSNYEFRWWRWSDWRFWFSGGDTLTVSRDFTIDGGYIACSNILVRRRGIFSCTISSTDLPMAVVEAIILAYQDSVVPEPAASYRPGVA